MPEAVQVRGPLPSMETLASKYTVGAPELAEPPEGPPDLPEYEPLTVNGRPMGYDRFEGINRLANLDVWDAVNSPAGLLEPPGHRGVIENLKLYLMYHAPDTIPQHLKQERVERLRDLIAMRQHPRPAWLTLTPTPDLANWAPVLYEDLGLDPSAVRNLRNVISASEKGPFEGNRILRHLLKDSSSRSRTSGKSDMNRWMTSVCEESLRAQQAPDEWEADHQRSKGMQYVYSGTSWDGWYWQSAWTSGTSSPSSSWSQRWSEPPHNFRRAGR